MIHVSEPRPRLVPELSLVTGGLSGLAGPEGWTIEAPATHMHGVGGLWTGAADPALHSGALFRMAPAPQEGSGPPLAVQGWPMPLNRLVSGVFFLSFLQNFALSS